MYYEIQRIISSDDYSEEEEIIEFAMLFDVYDYSHIQEIIKWLLVSNNAHNFTTAEFGVVSETYNIVNDLNHVVANFKRYYGISREELFEMKLLEYYSLFNAMMFEENSLTNIIKYRSYVQKSDDDPKYKAHMNKLKKTYKIQSGQKTIDRMTISQSEMMAKYQEIAKEVGLDKWQI